MLFIALSPMANRHGKQYVQLGGMTCAIYSSVTNGWSLATWHGIPETVQLRRYSVQLGGHVLFIALS